MTISGYKINNATLATTARSLVQFGDLGGLPSLK
jgi:hypothetical protein